jgi:hypothetical protein
MVVPSGDPGVAAPEARPGEETVVGSVVAEGRDATPPGESDTTDAMVIASDLYGVIVVRRAPLDSWESGPMPREVATATRQKLVALGWRVKDLAGLVGVSRDHMENVLLGNYGLSGWPAERLKNWLKADSPGRPESRQKPEKARRRPRNDNARDPRQMDLIEYIDRLAA